MKKIWLDLIHLWNHYYDQSLRHISCKPKTNFDNSQKIEQNVEYCELHLTSHIHEDLQYQWSAVISPENNDDFL